MVNGIDLLELILSLVIIVMGIIGLIILWDKLKQ